MCIERCGTYTFNSFSLALWRSQNEGDLFGSCKIDADKSCNKLLKIVLQRTPSRGIVQRDFSIFEGMRKFYYRPSVKKSTKYPFDIRAHLSWVHLKTVRRLWFPTSDRLETWLIPSGTTRSRQWHESTIVWRNLPQYDRFWYFVLSFFF